MKTLTALILIMGVAPAVKAQHPDNVSSPRICHSYAVLPLDWVVEPTGQKIEEALASRYRTLLSGEMTRRGIPVYGDKNTDTLGLPIDVGFVQSRVVDDRSPVVRVDAEGMCGSQLFVASPRARREQLSNQGTAELDSVVANVVGAWCASPRLTCLAVTSGQTRANPRRQSSADSVTSPGRSWLKPALIGGGIVAAILVVIAITRSSTSIVNTNCNVNGPTTVTNCSSSGAIAWRIVPRWPAKLPHLWPPQTPPPRGS
jgi:hypothetical protein